MIFRLTSANDCGLQTGSGYDEQGDTALSQVLKEFHGKKGTSKNCLDRFDFLQNPAT